ncbi:MAG TPA: asparagine synthase-related protein [Rhodocyclaceae bacterium]|nr:asparagine synthase-related protein [Rhodocyclaceae bacterium]
MSVIAGVVRFSGAPVRREELGIAAARLQAPGIGDPAYWCEGPAALLARQRIVTIEDMHERQPWTSSGGLVLVYDGRLDNREDVAGALGIPLGQEVVPDGRLLLAAVERWGSAALPRLIGDFVFALWDKTSRKLLLARDSQGRRTLLYHQGSDFVAFATTYPALLALPGVPRKIDELGVADFLILNSRHPSATFYQGVRRVPAATSMLFAGREPLVQRYWSPEPKRTIRLSSDQEYVEAAREHLDRAVACRLRAKDGIGAQMSGGLDSSAVASTAARLLAPGRLATVTAVPPEGLKLPPLSVSWYPDERSSVAAIAAMHPNMDTVFASSDGPHPIERDPVPFFEAGGMPARGISNIGWLLPGYEHLAQAGISVMLTGEGGNAAWSPDGTGRLLQLLLGGHWVSLARELRLLDQSRPYGWDGRTVLRREAQRLAPRWLMKWRRRKRLASHDLWHEYSAVNPGFAAEIDLSGRSRRSGHYAGLGGPAGGLASSLYLLSQMEHAKEVATALRAYTGIEHRSPLLDVRLLEFCLSLPEEQFFRDGINRRLPRLALADRLPASVWRNNLLGAQNPEIEVRIAAMRPVMRQEVADLQRVPLAARLLDLPRLARIVESSSDKIEVTLALPRALHVGRFLSWAESQGW